MTEAPDLFTYRPDKSQDAILVGIPPEVSQIFDRLALDLIQRGWSRYSSDAILHRIRWHFRVERGDRDFKCNDHWTARLSRWWMDKHPEHDGFFETRVLGRDRGEAA